jgi:hypothetical protein
MPPPTPSPELLERAHTHRAAASMLTKSPVWSLLVEFMQQKLAALETEVLNNAALSPDTLSRRRDERLFLRQTLTDFANGFRSAFTSPPPSEDTTLQKMAVPPEVEAALLRLITPRPPASQSPRPPASKPPPADPLNINPFDAPLAP